MNMEPNFAIETNHLDRFWFGKLLTYEVIDSIVSLIFAKKLGGREIERKQQKFQITFIRKKVLLLFLFLSLWSFKSIVGRDILGSQLFVV